jgi:hypothetical protein
MSMMLLSARGWRAAEASHPRRTRLDREVTPARELGLLPLQRRCTRRRHRQALVLGRSRS